MINKKNEKEVIILLLFLILLNFQHYLQELVLEQTHQLQILFFPQLEKYQLQLQHSHLGNELMAKIKEDMKDIGKIELQPKFDGKQMIMVIQPL